MKNINVGIIGLGTVGGGTARTLISKEYLIRQKTGTRVKLLKVFDADKKRYAEHKIPKKMRSRSVNEIINNPVIGCCCCCKNWEIRRNGMNYSHDASIARSKIVSPIRNTMSFINYQ